MLTSAIPPIAYLVAKDRLEAVRIGPDLPAR
jgi:hypothetical protein